MLEPKKENDAIDFVDVDNGVIHTSWLSVDEAQIQLVECVKWVIDI